MFGTSQRFRKFTSGTAVAAAAIILAISIAPLKASTASSGSLLAPIAYVGHLVVVDVTVTAKARTNPRSIRAHPERA